MRQKLSVYFVFTISFIFLSAVFILSLVNLKNVESRYQVSQFFPKDHSGLRNHREVTNKFQLNELSPFLVVLEIPASQNKNWFSQDKTQELQKWISQVEEFDNVKKVTSFVNIESLYQVESGLQIGSIPDVIPQNLWQSEVENSKLLLQFFEKNNFRKTLVSIEPEMSGNQEIALLKRSVDQSLNDMKWDISVVTSGLPVVQTQLAAHLEREIVKYLAACLFLFCLAMLIFFKGFSSFFITSIYLIIINIVAIGILGFLKIPLSVLSSTLPMIVSIVAVSLIVHTLHAWSDLMKNRQRLNFIDSFKTAIGCLKGLLLANILGSLTTAVGFAALAAVPLPIVREYSMIVCGSIFGVFVVTHLLFLVTMPFFVPRLRDWSNEKAYWILRPLRYSKLSISFGLVLIVIAILALGSLNFSTRLFNDMAATHPISQDLALIDSQFGGIIQYDLQILAEKNGYWKEPHRMQQLTDLTNGFKQISGVGSVSSVADFLTPQQKRQVASLNEGLFLYSMSNNDPLMNYIDTDFKTIRLSIRLHDLEGKEVDRIRATMKSRILSMDSNLKINEGGVARYSHMINQEVSKELIYGFWVSILVIGGMLAVMFRSLRWAILACIPNLIPPAVLITTLALAQTPIKPAVGLIFSIALGLAFNNTVYLLSRLKSFYKGGLYLPLKKSLLIEGVPCLSESLLTFIGFSIFLTSDFQLNQVFGAYMILSVLAGFWGDLIFLPAILNKFPKLLTVSQKSKYFQTNRDSRKMDRVATQESIIENQKNEQKKSKTGQKAAGFLFFLLSSLFHPTDSTAQNKSTSEALTPRQILEKARKNVETKSDSAQIKMTIIEKNGDKKERVLQATTLKKDGVFHALVRVLSPMDVKGTAVLAEIQEDQENQWLYLPSTKEVRRIVSSKKNSSGGVLGSELSPQDLNAEAIQGAAVDLRKDQGASWLLEIRPKKGNSEYSNVLMTIEKNQNRLIKLEYFSKKKLAKTVDFENYTMISGVHRAQKISIQNHLNKRGTLVELTDIKVNLDIDASSFNPQKLKKGI